MVYGAILGAVTGLAVTALFFLGEGFAGLPFVPFDLFDQLARALPGGLLTAFIEVMVAAIRGLNLGATDEVAKLVEQLMATGMTALFGALFGMALAWAVLRKGFVGWWVGALAGFVLFMLVAVFEFGRGISGSPMLALLWMGMVLTGWGAVLGGWVEEAVGAPGQARPEAGPGLTRRAFLTRALGGTLALAISAFGVGRFFGDNRRATGADQPLAVAGQPQPTPSARPTAVVRPGAAPGTRPEITPNEDFYRIDINLVSPSLNGDTWTLEMEGLFDNPRTLTLADIMAMPAVTQPYTLSCISNPVGGDLIGNTYWTGVRSVDLMKDLGLRPEAKGVRVVAADGFVEFVSRADLEDPRTFFVYGMNGKTLPTEHGFPLRILMPDRYGMKQPKWITRFVAVDQEELGYWVVRGWSKEARPQITSVIDTIAKGAALDGKIPVGGIAWAGARGITKVEVQVDNGAWQEATLLTPTVGPLTWVQWRYDWPSMSGRHTFKVRATDGTGALQPEEETTTHPDGATGYHSVTENI